MPRRVRPGASPTDTGDACPWRERPGLPRIARIMLVRGIHLTGLADLNEAVFRFNRC